MTTFLFCAMVMVPAKVFAEGGSGSDTFYSRAENATGFGR